MIKFVLKWFEKRKNPVHKVSSNVDIERRIDQGLERLRVLEEVPFDIDFLQRIFSQIERRELRVARVEMNYAYYLGVLSYLQQNGGQQYDPGRIWNATIMINNTLSEPTAYAEPIQRLEDSRVLDRMREIADYDQEQLNTFLKEASHDEPQDYLKLLVAENDQTITKFEF
ncbi:MAG: hypothetical protein Q7R33_08005 [Nitrosarchaeum sp.]|nr:hypothetical protein [Nitrosarchaeum sp.]